MRGLPHRFNTRKDVETCFELAKQGKLDAGEIKKRLQAMLNTDKHYVFDKVLDNPDSADGPEPDFKVMEQEGNDDTKEYVQYKLAKNPGAIFRQLGFAREEIESLISQL